MMYLGIEQVRIIQGAIADNLKVTYLETTINQIVARLYGLTTDDLALITGRTP